MIDLWNACFRSFLEAFSEFLPISSTGHLFLFSYFFPFQSITENREQFEDLFDIFIQSGAILSVIVLYWKTFYRNLVEWKTSQFYPTLILGSLPILVLGFAFKSRLDVIKQSQYLLLILSCSWIIGGVFILVAERFLKPTEHSHSVETKETKLGYRQSLLIGIFQCIALIPGISRSLCTIFSARILGYSKTIATEYSFFLAVPALVMAGLYKLFKHRSVLNSETIPLLSLGFLLSFLLSVLVIRLFLKFIRTKSFSIFGIYRIVLGILVLAYFLKK